MGRFTASIALVFCSLSFVSCGMGRTPSRVMGKDYRQVLGVHDLKTFVSISMYTYDGKTVKDVTYVADDGFTYTQEFVDDHMFEGVIRWVPVGTDESFFRGRTLSRVLGKPTNLAMPDDCKQILQVVIAQDGSNRAKNLVYLSKAGQIFVKEYRDGFLDGEGWLEVKRKN